MCADTSIRLRRSLNFWTRLLIATALLALGAPAHAAEKITYYHLDALSSPVAATDALGNVVWKETYAPYGSQIQKPPAAASNDRWYTGKPYDSDVGLSYFGARWYDPSIGRFMGVDPLELHDIDIDRASTHRVLHSFNRYSYAANNPYAYVDADGQVFMGACVYSGQCTMQEATGVIDMETRALEAGATGAAIVGVTVLGGEAAYPALRLVGSGIVLRGSLSRLFANGRAPWASELVKYAEKQGWNLKKNPNGPLKYVDENGVPRLTIKKGSPRTPGSESPHAEIRSPNGQRIDPSGNPVTRNDPGNHTPIKWDL